MINLKNKNNIICKKFLCSTLIILFSFLVNIINTSFASLETPPYAPTSFVGEVGNGISKAIQQIAKYYFGQKNITIDNVTKVVSEQITESISRIIDITYPVGSIYMSVNDVNPATIIGGVWERWGAGRVPVGVNTTQSEFSSAEKTGGEKAHTLTIDEMPSHQHVIPGATCCWGTGINNVAYIPQSVRLGTTGCNELLFTTTGAAINVNTCGNGKPQSLLQPYVTCYMWKRIA